MRHQRQLRRLECLVGAAAFLWLWGFAPNRALAQLGERAIGAKSRSQEIEKQQQELIAKIRAAHPSLTSAEINEVRRRIQAWTPEPLPASSESARLTPNRGRQRGSLSEQQGNIHLEPPATEAVVITGMRLASGREILMGSSLSDLAGNGVPEVFSPTEIEGTMRERLGTLSPSRVYFSGDPLKSVDLSKLCDERGIEMLYRSPKALRDLFDTNHRLEVIANRRLEEEQLTIFNGLPRNAEEVRAMGPWAGRPEDWLDLRRTVEKTLGGRVANRGTTEEDLFHEFSVGQHDVVILVAHSTGSEFYLNGKKTSIKELQDRPRRWAKPQRARLAVLIACDAGKRNYFEHSGVLARVTQALGIQEQFSPLAQVLIDQGYVDKVFAPDHRMDATEVQTVLRNFMEGGRTAKSLFEGWTSWAMDWLRALKQEVENA